MPYIKQESRDRLVDIESAISNVFLEIKDSGELNYLFTLIIRKYLKTQTNYKRFNDIIGALEGAKLELYRRQVVDYEDLKIKENGDVYEEFL